MLSTYSESWMPIGILFRYSLQNVPPQQKQPNRGKEQKVIYVAIHNNIQLWPIVLTFIKFNPALPTFLATNTRKTRGLLWDQIQHNYGNGLPFSPSPPQPHPPVPSLHPSLAHTGRESISGSLKTCQMCSDQCNGLRVHYIHSAPFYEVTSWRGLPACRSALPHSKPSLAEVSGGRNGGKGGDGWMKGGDGSQPFLNAVLG